MLFSNRNRSLWRVSMDRSSGKRGAGGSVTPRKTYTATSFKEAASEGNQSAQFCNRIGCSGRIKFNQTARIGISDKSKYSKPSFRTSSGNEVAGKSSRSNSVVTTAQRSCLDSSRKMLSQVTSDSSGSSLSTESETPGVVSSPSNLNRYQSVSMTSSREVNMTEAGSSSASTSVVPQKTVRYKSGLRNQSTSAASPVTSASKSSALEPFNRINGSRYGLRNLRCNSVSDAIPPSCSQLESESVRKNFIKKRSSEGESSSSNRGRTNTASPNIDRHTSPSTTGVSTSDLAYSSSAPVDDSSGSSSTWNRRSTNVNARMRFSSRQDGRNSSAIREPSVSFSRNDYEIPLNVSDGRSSQQFSVSGSRSHRRSSNNSENSSSRTSFASAESGSTHVMNRDVLRRFNMDGIAEVAAFLSTSSSSLSSSYMEVGARVSDWILVLCPLADITGSWENRTRWRIDTWGIHIFICYDTNILNFVINLSLYAANTCTGDQFVPQWPQPLRPTPWHETRYW